MARVAYLILKVSKRYSLKVIQVYAPTSSHSDEEVEAVYEDISKAMHSLETYFTVVVGDFNANLGKRDGDKLRVGQLGVGSRNHRGYLLASFMKKEGLFMINSFYKKREHRSVLKRPSSRIRALKFFKSSGYWAEPARQIEN